MNIDQWRESVLTQLAELSGEGREAADFLRARRSRIGFRAARRNVGAFWTVFGSVYVNSRLYTAEDSLSNLYLLTLIIHEAWHLRQGFFKALSVYGELEAWQMQFRLLGQHGGNVSHPAIKELLALPLGWDRANLARAQGLMRTYAGRGYRADLLPLYPLGDEIRYRLNELLRKIRGLPG